MLTFIGVQKVRMQAAMLCTCRACCTAEAGMQHAMWQAGSCVKECDTGRAAALSTGAIQCCKPGDERAGRKSAGIPWALYATHRMRRARAQAARAFRAILCCSPVI